ncbi:uncharacterized protein LOC112527295 isoform X1 [Cynara cardunculus var. scolymus]|uniref:uncharacterized protein LOC112527295 isoform X1 n=1 Tax=Cynara cardunculus var. scolymus TaxID=59895 RepID=UPI000D62F2D9|nr:uncharacterized protein LOC112527295 isoform X1 [Cynara cardunculus var. scolymus]
MRNPAAVLNRRFHRYSSSELLPLLLLCLLLSLSFSIHSVRSKSNTSNREEPVQWQILTKLNFSSQIRLNPHILLIVTVPWSGESRSLMKELAHMVTKKKEKFRTLKLMLVHKNHDKMLADALGATMEVTVICYRHSLPYNYRGTLRVQSILSSVHYLMSLLPEEVPFKSLPTTEDLTTFLKSTDKALLVLDFCGWTPKLMTKVMNNGSENAFGVPFGTGLYGESSDASSADGKQIQGMDNEKITCDVDNQHQFSGLPGLGEFSPLNESDFLEAEKMRSSDVGSCSFEEFQLIESSLSNFTRSIREFFLPPERLKFGLVSERLLISSLGVRVTGSWLMMLYSAGCPSCAKVFKGGSDLKRILEIHASPVMELKGDEYGFDPGLPSDKPSVLLFIDRSSDSLKIRRKSKESLTVFRELALHNYIPSKMNAPKVVDPERPFMETVPQHPKLEMSASSQKLTALKDKISIMVMNEGKHIAFDGVASDLQGSSLQEVLAYVLQQKKERKLSSLAKDVGFQLLSDDIDIKMSETEVQSDDKPAEPSVKGLIGSDVDLKKDQVSFMDDMLHGAYDTLPGHTKIEHSTEDDEKNSVETSAQLSVKTEDRHQEELTANIEDEKVGLQGLNLAGSNGSFFFVDGQFRLLEALAGVLKIPSLVIIDPLPHQHYVYPKEADFSYSSLSCFFHMFLNGSLLPYQRSMPVVPNSKEAPKPPFINHDFHEVDSIPHVSALTFMELVVGNHSGSLSADNAWKKDVLVLFTSNWCGFCMRMELVVREVYRAFKGYGNMMKTPFRNEQSSSRNDGINNTIPKLPVIYMMDCIKNDCSSLLKSLTKRDLYPSLLLYPAERKEAVSYDGETSVVNVIKFIADQGGNSQWIYKEQGILWAEAEQGAWNEKPFKDASEPMHEDVSLSKDNREIILKDRTQIQKLEIEKNKIGLHTPYDLSVSGHEVLPGSILVASEKLLDVYPFARSKILIVKANRSIGFQGLIINKLISWDSITELEEGLESLKEAPLSYGGPVSARGLPLVSLTRQPSRDEHPEVLPDIYFLDQWATINLIQNLKLHNRSMTDYWFFVGYSAWGWNQLFDEITDGSWTINDGTVQQFDWPVT